MNNNEDNKLKRQQITSGFTQAGVYARRQFCADLEVYRPPEPLCTPACVKPPPRYVQAGVSAVDSEMEN